MNHTKIIADDWNRHSDGYYERIYCRSEIEKITADPMYAFPAEIKSMLCSAFPDLRGKHILVPSSGDNAAVFAFHLLGAVVTSADISDRQLYNARKIANERGWNIRFVQDDSMTLAQIGDGQYDLVYTSNGVHVWINDLYAMYRSFFRVLKPHGKYIMFETHPFIRPFNGDEADKGRFVVEKPYDHIGPSGDLPVMAWRIMDLQNAMTDAGFIIKHTEEFRSQPESFSKWWYKTTAEAEEDGYKKFDWKQNPATALPQWIGFSTIKGAIP